MQRTLIENKKIMQDNMTGYPSIDKPWLKYYSDEDINTPLPACTMYELLYDHNKECLNDIALNYYGNKITYGALFEKIELTARTLFTLRVRAGDIVAICSVNIPETIYTIYALNRLGAIADMIDPRTSVAGVHEYLVKTNAQVIFVIDMAYSLIKEAAKDLCIQHIVVLSPSDSLPILKKVIYKIKNKVPASKNNILTWNDFLSVECQTVPDYCSYKENSCCVIAHTGGTTGEPKSVMLSNDNLNAVVHGYRYLGIPFERQQRYFNDLPPFIMYGFCLATHATLCFGLEVILYPIFDSQRFPKQFLKYKPHHFSALPDHLKYMIEDKTIKNMDLAYFITAAVGGDSLNKELERESNNFLYDRHCQYSVTKGYGMTELSSTACTSCPKANAIGSVGIPLIMNTIKIMNIDTMKELPYDQIGEIWISGPSIMLGYYHNEKETNSIISIDEKGERWIRTGDLGYMTKEGLLFHEGRIRRIYLTSYEGQPAKIFPMLVEEKIKLCESILDCVVVARLKENSANYETVAFLILKNEKEFSDKIRKELEDICIQEIPSYMWPVEYKVVTEFPHTPIGKVDFQKLEQEII